MPEFPPHLQPVPGNGGPPTADTVQYNPQQFNPNQMFAGIMAAFDQVVPQPINCQFRVDVMNHPQGNQVILFVMSPTGMNVFFMQPDVAKTIGEVITRSGQLASTGLHVPPSPLGG